MNACTVSNWTETSIPCCKNNQKQHIKKQDRDMIDNIRRKEHSMSFQFIMIGVPTF